MVPSETYNGTPQEASISSRWPCGKSVDGKLGKDALETIEKRATPDRAEYFGFWQLMTISVRRQPSGKVPLSKT